MSKTWKDIKKEITSISEEEKQDIDIRVQIVSAIVLALDAKKLDAVNAEVKCHIRRGILRKAICETTDTATDITLNELIKVQRVLGIPLFDGIKSLSAEEGTPSPSEVFIKKCKKAGLRMDSEIANAIIKTFILNISLDGANRSLLDLDGVTVGVVNAASSKPKDSDISHLIIVFSKFPNFIDKTFKACKVLSVYNTSNFRDRLLTDAGFIIEDDNALCLVLRLVVETLRELKNGSYMITDDVELEIKNPIEQKIDEAVQLEDDLNAKKKEAKIESISNEIKVASVFVKECMNRKFKMDLDFATDMIEAFLIFVTKDTGSAAVYLFDDLQLNIDKVHIADFIKDRIEIDTFTNPISTKIEKERIKFSFSSNKNTSAPYFDYLLENYGCMAQEDPKIRYELITALIISLVNTLAEGVYSFEKFDLAVIR